MESKKNWPFDEFAAENSPEYESLFAEIAGELAYRRRVKQMENDLYLRNFAKGWAGTMKDREDGSVLDPPIPAEYVQQWFRMTGPQSNYSGQRKDVESITAGGVVMSPSPEGGVTMRQGASGSIVVTADQIVVFLDGFRQTATQRPPNVPSPAANIASSPRQFSQNELVFQSSEQRKKRLEENLKEMEKWAKNSAFEYPRYG